MSFFMMNNKYFDGEKYYQDLEKAIGEVREKMNEQISEEWEQIGEDVWEHKRLEVVIKLETTPKYAKKIV